MFWRKRKIKKICVIRLGKIGDIVQASATIRALRSEYPDAKITFVTGEDRREIMNNSPLVDEILTFGHDSGHLKYPGEDISLTFKLLGRRFDLLLDLQGSGRTRMVSFWSFPWRRTPVIGAYNKYSNLQRYEFFLKKLGVCESLPPMEFFQSSDVLKFADKFLQRVGISSDDLIVGLNPGTSWLTKSWPGECFAQVGNYFSLAHGAKTIVFGGPDDREKALEVYKLMDKKPILTPGRTSFEESCALLARCKLFITGDTGLMQIARGLKIPTIAIFGGTDPFQNTEPIPDFMRVLRNDDCPSCYKNLCPLKTRACLWAITPEVVIENGESLLDLDQLSGTETE